MREEDVPAQQPEAQEEARLPAPDAHPRGSSGARPSAREGPPPAVRLIWRVRDRDAFRALARGRRLRSGCLAVTRVPAPTGPPRVAYAVGRPVGGAVVRNRVRRRLRAAVAESRDRLVPASAYLVSAGAGSAELSYPELRGTLAELLERARAS